MRPSCPSQFCPNQGMLLNLHKMIKDVEKKCCIQKNFTLPRYMNYFPILNFLVRSLTPEVLKGIYSNCIHGIEHSKEVQSLRTICLASFCYYLSFTSSVYLSYILLKSYTRYFVLIVHSDRGHCKEMNSSFLLPHQPHPHLGARLLKEDMLMALSIRPSVITLLSGT